MDYAALQPGDGLANRFCIEEKLGQGGFAVAYRAFDSFSDTSRVLKIIVRDRRSTFERLKQEYGILERLHRHGVFHRDVKPSNLLWTDRGVRIIDFNVAVRHDDEDARPGGTRRYVPPDLEIDEDMTAAEKADWDLFSLGVTLYECISGKYPWEGATPVRGATPTDPLELRSPAIPRPRSYRPTYSRHR